ncbi:MAG: hypothetical protein ACLUR5_00185 [Eubacterium ventriosum]
MPNVENKNLANFNDDFMVSARKFIKGDEDMLNTISYKIKANPPAVAVVNYVANHNTLHYMMRFLTIRKYNQANGENNRTVQFIIIVGIVALRAIQENVK